MVKWILITLVVALALLLMIAAFDYAHDNQAGPVPLAPPPTTRVCSMPDGANAYIHMALTKHSQVKSTTLWQISSIPGYHQPASHEVFATFTLLDPHTGVLTWGAQQGFDVDWGGLSIVEQDGQVNFIEPSHFYRDKRYQNTLSVKFHTFGRQQLVVYGAFRGNAFVNDCRTPNLGHPVLVGS